VKSPARVVDRFPIVPVVLLSVVTVPDVKIPVVPVVVPAVSVGINAVVIVPFVIVAAVDVVVPAVRVGIVPVVIVAAVDVVVPNVPVGIRAVVIVPDVKMPAVPVVVPAVSVGIVPSVMLAVLAVKLEIVPVVLAKARLEVGTASATNALSFAAVTSFVTPSVKEVPAVKLGTIDYPPLISLDLTKSQAMLIIAPSPPATSSILALSPSMAFTLLDRSPKLDKDLSSMDIKVI